MTNYSKVSDYIEHDFKGITPKYVNNSSIIVLNQKCIRNHNIDYSLSQFTDDKQNISDSKFLKIGDILINSTGTGTAGRCAFVNRLPEGKKVITDSHILVLRCKSYDIAACLSYQLFSVEKLLMTFMTGSSGQSEFDKVRLFDLKLKVLNEPASLKNNLKLMFDIDRKIENNFEINFKLEQLAKLIYDYWFIQFDFPDSNGKPYKSSGGKMVWSERLKREIPEGWNSGILGDIFKFNPSLTLKKDSISSYLDMEALNDSGFMTGSIMRKPFNGGVKFQNGDVVIARITPCLENGKTGLITLLSQGEVGFGSTEFIVIRGKNAKLSSFASCLSRSSSFRKYAIQNMVGTSGRKRVEAAVLESYPLPVPPNDLLTSFENFVGPYYDTETNNTIQNEVLVKLRNWLLPMLMNGQIKVDGEN